MPKFSSRDNYRLLRDQRTSNNRCVLDDFLMVIFGSIYFLPQNDDLIYKKNSQVIHSIDSSREWKLMVPNTSQYH